MRFVRKIHSLEREIVFHDASERRLFWRSSAISLRPLAVWVQVFGIVGWMLSRVFASPGAAFDRTETVVALAGMLMGSATTYFSRHVVLNSLGCFVCAVAVAFGFHSNASGTPNPEVWVMPMGILITVGMAPVFADYFSYLASAIAAWLILSYGRGEFIMHSHDSGWIILFIFAGTALGLLLNFLFVRERKRTFLVQRELIKLAFKDALTGIDNRRSLMEAMQDYHARSASNDFYFLLIDIDDFKRINDTSGHDVGDEVLVAVASIIDRHAQTHARGRLGGEEFGVVFTGEEAAACALARQLCESVAKLRISTHVVTISIGISRFSDAMSLAEIFKVADQGLYEAKRHGKNRYVLVS
ncbi:GGDEF domain-containing protein [Paraburkholderia sp. BCC1885]|uniref:GGDEF domain-containing protein n=1 Tax=Paraburkholderia sp. BCC1885 TaxID=2562669 RepID=UPI0011829843|nr:GGDEF domain-containing protein [Paraburkholderia sp. BCC1885]